MTESGTPGAAETAIGAARATMSVASAVFIGIEEHPLCLALKKHCGIIYEVKRRGSPSLSIILNTSLDQMTHLRDDLHPLIQGRGTPMSWNQDIEVLG